MGNLDDAARARLSEVAKKQPRGPKGRFGFGKNPKSKAPTVEPAHARKTFRVKTDQEILSEQDAKILAQHQRMIAEKNEEQKTQEQRDQERSAARRTAYQEFRSDHQELRRFYNEARNTGSVGEIYPNKLFGQLLASGRGDGTMPPFITDGTGKKVGFIAVSDQTAIVDGQGGQANIVYSPWVDKDSLGQGLEMRALKEALAQPYSNESTYLVGLDDDDPQVSTDDEFPTGKDDYRLLDYTRVKKIKARVSVADGNTAFAVELIKDGWVLDKEDPQTKGLFSIFTKKVKAVRG